MSAAADGSPVEELLDDVLPLLPGVRDRALWGGAVRPRMVRLEPVHVDRRAALETPRKRKCVGIRPRKGLHPEGPLPSRPQLPDLGGVQQFLGPKQHLIAHLKDCVHPTPVQLLLADPLCRMKQCAHLIL
jgi:hypothetical protein